MLDPFLGVGPGWNVLSAGLRPEPFLVLLAAFALDALGGGRLRRFAWHPTRLVEAAVGYLEPRLNRAERGAANRLGRGLMAVVILALVSAGAGWAVTALGSLAPFGWLAVLAAVTMLIEQRRPFEEARRRMIHLDGGGVGEPSAAVASLAISVAGGVIGVSFWFALLGLPGLAAYRAVAVIAALLDERRTEIGVFGLTPSRLNEALSYLPAVLAGLVVAGAALFVPGARPERGFADMIREAPKHHNLAQGFVVAAMRGSLGASRGALELRRALYLYTVACLLNVALVALLAMASFAI